MELMRISKELKIGQVYRFHHARKGTFVGQLIGVERADPADEADDLLLTVKYDVRPGTDQARLKTTDADVRVSNIRPSLVVSIEEAGEGDWLREVKVAPQPRPDKELLTALRDLTAAVKAGKEG